MRSHNQWTADRKYVHFVSDQKPEGEYVGIITRVDPIDIWNIESTPKLKPKKLPNSPHAPTQKESNSLNTDLSKLSDLLSTENEKENDKNTNTKSTKRRLQSGGRGTRKRVDPRLKHPEYVVDEHPKSRPSAPKPVPMELDPKMTRIKEREYMPRARGGYPHIAASFNLHLDKPVAIIGARFADFAENNANQRMAEAKDLAKFVNLYRHDYHVIVVGDFNC